jgi:hypothetical protein
VKQQCKAVEAALKVVQVAPPPRKLSLKATQVVAPQRKLNPKATQAAPPHRKHSPKVLEAGASKCAVCTHVSINS